MIRYKKMERKSVALRIGPAGVEVRLPLGVSARSAEIKRVVATQLSKAARLAPTDPEPTRALAKAELMREVDEWTVRLGVAPRRTQVRRMSSRWGSCTSLGNVTLSERILRMPLSLRDYLICHEITHLHELSHGSGFQRLMSAAMPDWRKREKELCGWVARQELAVLSRR